MLEFVERRTPAAENVSRVASGAPATDSGEQEAIALALGNLPGDKATLAIDDRRGVRRAGRLGIPVIGTLAILVRLHHLGYSRRSFDQDLAALEEAGMYLTDELKRRVIERFRAGGDDDRLGKEG